MNDLISRREVIRWVKTECNPYGKPTLDFESGKKAIEHLEQMPSAQLEPCGDMISREYLKEHIEACWINGRPRHAPELNELLSWIDDVPSAQPEIIRCKECKYASPNGKYGCKAYHFKPYETHEMKADDFCSKAERKIR